MCRNYVIEINPNEAIRVETHRFKRRLKLDIAEGFNVYVMYDGVDRRVENCDLKKAYKNYKKFRKKKVVFTIVKDSVKKIPWGIGQIKVGERLVGINGVFDCEIDNFKLFQKRFGQRVLVSELKNEFIEIIHSIVYNAVRDYSSKKNLDLGEMNRNKNELKEELIERFKSEILFSSMGIELKDFEIKSFIITKREVKENENE